MYRCWCGRVDLGSPWIVTVSDLTGRHGHGYCFLYGTSTDAGTT